MVTSASIGACAGTVVGSVVGAVVDEVWFDRRFAGRPLLLSPSLAPTFLQPLLWAASALCNPPGDVLNDQSDVGGVVGGVIGSAAGGELALVLLSSVRTSRSAVSAEDIADRPATRPRPSAGRNLGDRLESSDSLAESFGTLIRARPSRESCTSSSSGASVDAGATDSINGTRTESFINS